MLHIVNESEQRKGAIAAVEFEGKPYSAGVSFFIGDLVPGKGTRMHRHPYSETCIVRSGKVAMTVDGQEIIAGAGDIVVIGSGTPHCFTAVGDERLVAICIHASERFVIEWLDDRQ